MDYWIINKYISYVLSTSSLLALYSNYSLLIKHCEGLTMRHWYMLIASQNVPESRSRFNIPDEPPFLLPLGKMKSVNITSKYIVIQ